MKKLLLISATLIGGYVYAQNCIVPAPVKPPKAEQVIIDNFPADGGHIGCRAHATSTTGVVSSNTYALGAAKCLQAKTIGDQIVANDNGWNDGGAP
jgi:hypothetical protein